MVTSMTPTLHGINVGPVTCQRSTLVSESDDTGMLRRPQNLTCVGFDLFVQQG